jgi:hypothetical protein
MSALLDIQEKIEDTEAALRKAEKALVEHPESSTASVALKSIMKRKQLLAEEFSENARDAALDVCRYRIFSETGDSVKVASLAAVLSDFQSLYTTVFDAIQNGPKLRAKIDAVIAKKTSFDFGYSFTGSVGIVMTVPSDLVLIGETDFDRTARAIFEMASATNSEQIAAYAKKLGVASIRKLFRWARNHSASMTGADIEWKKGHETVSKCFVQAPELALLAEVIEQTSEEVSETVDITGTLVGLDVTMRRFHMTFPDAPDIKGEIAPIIGTKKTLEIPKIYTVSLLKKTRVNLATENEETEYILLSA